ncbi:MAG: dienelactone hydrolase family protein [Myxococcales bacterium]|nr:dienelactone hydrolase family protein [Myxococcales bacterium]
MAISGAALVRGMGSGFCVWWVLFGGAGCAPSSKPAAVVTTEVSLASLTVEDEALEAEFAALHTSTTATVRGRLVSYGGRQAYLSLPKEAQPHAGVILVHDWWGLDKNALLWSERLAGEGYAVLAVDLYGGRVARNIPQALELQHYLKPAFAEQVIRAALSFLRGGTEVQVSKIATIGWSIGGEWALRAGLMDKDIAGVVMYYGKPVGKSTPLHPLAAKLLAIFGKKDGSIPLVDVTKFQQRLEEAGCNANIQLYDALHGFANPSRRNYEGKSAAAAWQQVQGFLAEILRPAPEI